MSRAFGLIPRIVSSLMAQVVIGGLGLRDLRGDVALATAPLFVGNWRKLHVHS